MGGNPNRLGVDITDEDPVAWFVKGCLEAAIRHTAECDTKDTDDGKELCKKDFNEKQDLVCVQNDEGGAVVVGDKEDQTSLSPAKGKRRVPNKVKVRVHCKKIFSRIRKNWGLISDTLSEESRGVWSDSMSPGKSGTRMYCVNNLLLKTMSEGETEFLKKLLPSYVNHIAENPYGSHLPKLLSWYTVSYRHGVSLVTERLLVMNNILASPQKIPTIYDLKGSSFGRSAVSPPPGTPPPESPPRRGSIILKDNDLMGRILHIPRAAEVFGQLKRDVDFLEGHNIVDYSFLVGVRKDDGEGPDCGTPATDSSKEVYYIGMIDILTQYTPMKRIETRLLGFVADENTISAVPADQYSARFLGRIAGVLEIDNWELVEKEPLHEG
eukprot:TRINITY_DN11613_c1_g2_i1.p1 TRINITY_DN11613_c1_g2~~TRINITY_DN11613_c1_g2_i1.p1  ORF type:complete len:392 (+),score=55.21 TRINITY_DN11613_c1_g2_i1:34-1176(+)